MSKLFPTFYEANVIEQVAINLFYGWGYNLYRDENALRADSLLIRAKVSDLLGNARIALTKAETEFRREHLPPPSREKPRPDPEALVSVRLLEALIRQIGFIEGQVRTLPVPETDRVHQRYRDTNTVLTQMILADKAIAGQAEMLRQGLDGVSGQDVCANVTDVKAAIAAVEASVERRRAIL